MLLRKLGLNKKVQPQPGAKEALRNLTLQELTPFSFDGHVFSPAKVVRVYDGDTVKVAVLSPWDNLPTLLTVRMWGTDADELAPAHDLPNRDEIRMRAMRARNRLVQLTTDVNVELADTQKSVKDVQTMIDARNQKLVTVQCRGFDCFGRVLGVLYDLDGTCINKVMLDEELVKPRPASEGAPVCGTAPTGPGHSPPSSSTMSTLSIAPPRTMGAFILDPPPAPSSASSISTGRSFVDICYYAS
eukprot:jgi/Mesvir1/8310/Mv12575-RA.1